MSESIILCEGYDDRAFWAGWLKHSGCTIPKDGDKVVDSSEKIVSNGQFMYRSKSEKFIRLVPCHGKPKIRGSARSQLKQRTIKPFLTHLIINIDPDINAHGTDTATGLRLQNIHDLVHEFDKEATKTDDGDIAMDGGSTIVSLVRWEASDVAGDGIPTKQTLERLVCAAIVAAYPDRGPKVQEWLDSRNGTPKAGPKEFGWSHMAGWYADHGCADFYKNLWRDDRIVAELKPRLVECGAWRIAEMLAE